MSNLVPVSDIEKMATAIASSNFFGMKTKEQAMALMFIAQAEGKHPATAAQEYHVIQGKPALKADAMMARFQAAGGKVEWKEYTDKEVTGVFSHAQGGSVTITWTIEMATAAKLTGKDTWKQYPRQMLRARVISEGIRTVYPGVAVGVYTPEEVQDFDNRPMVDVTPPEHTTPKQERVLPYDIDETKPKSMFKNNVARTQYQTNVSESLHKATTVAQLNEIIRLELDKFTQLRNSGDERDQMLADGLSNIYKSCLVKLKDPTPPEDLGEFDEEEGGDYLKRQMNEERERIAAMGIGF